LIDSLIDWLFDWLIDWLIPWRIQRPTRQARRHAISLQTRKKDFMLSLKWLSSFSLTSRQVGNHVPMYGRILLLYRE
jgi:hypothetical protein